MKLRKQSVEIEVPSGRSCSSCTFVKSLPGAPMCPYFGQSVYHRDDDGIHFVRCQKCVWAFGLEVEE